MSKPEPLNLEEAKSESTEISERTMKVEEVFNLEFTESEDIRKWKRLKLNEDSLIKEWKRIVGQRE